MGSFEVFIGDFQLASGMFHVPDKSSLRNHHGSFMQCIMLSYYCLLIVYVGVLWVTSLQDCEICHLIMSPPCSGGRGRHLDLLWFPVTRMWVGVRLRLPDFFYAIFPSFLLMAFKFSDMVTMVKTLNWLTFCDLGSIFKITEGHYVSKLTLFMRYFLQFCTDGF